MVHNYHDDNGNFYYSADASLDIWRKIQILKKFIPETSFPGFPPNAVLEKNGDPNQCCSGYAEDININGEIQRTCKLRDFTDISHLLNRYVSL